MFQNHNFPPRDKTHKTLHNRHHHSLYLRSLMYTVQEYSDPHHRRRNQDKNRMNPRNRHRHSLDLRT